MRERWFGSTGRKIPEIALSGSVDVSGALQLDDVSEIAAIEAAHAEGTPVVVTAGSLAEVTAALQRPEVACVLVTDPALLEVDLADITYG
jgi:hypothetical protein